jgi:NADPH-dependent curcumin reductase CurA
MVTMNLTTTGREIHLITRPRGWPVADNFELVTKEVEAAPEDVVVRNQFLSVDPYMRGRMSDARSYSPPFQLGHVMDGGAVGKVVSASPGAILAPGDTVLHRLGWREFAVGPPAAFRQIQPLPGVPASAYLGALGMPGLTAYVGLLDIAHFQPGESVFVSAAAGAVGSMVGQLARSRGAGLVIGSAGSAAKVEHLTRDLGYDTAFNYHDGDITALLTAAAGERGIDVYFDNVGGDHLEAALAVLRPHGRVAMCGSISSYNAESAPPGPRNLTLAVGKRLRLEGFLVGDHLDREAEFLSEVGGGILAGTTVADETVVAGIENMVEAFLGMMRGTNLGKMVVRVGD